MLPRSHLNRRDNYTVATLKWYFLQRDLVFIKRQYFIKGTKLHNGQKEKGSGSKIYQTERET